MTGARRRPEPSTSQRTRTATGADGGTSPRHRVAFFGTPRIAVPALEAILAAGDMELVAVVTNPDRPRGRSREPQPPPVKAAVANLDVPVLQPSKAAEVAADLEALAPDVAAVVAYGRLLPRRLLDAAAHGFVNLHFSLLPRWRGAAPVQHAIRAGDTTTGVTTFLLDEGMDTGPVFESVRVEIGPDETAGELLERLARLGAPILVDSLRSAASGRKPTPQPEEGVTLAPKIDTEDVRIDWHGDAASVVDLVRSANPAPGAHTTFRGGRFKIHRAREADVVGEGPPGHVAVTDSGPHVSCGTGAVLLEEVQPAGKARMAGTDFANGYQPDGEVLGEDPDGP